MNKEPKINKDSQLFVIRGEAIRSGIYERVRSYTAERQECLSNVAQILDSKLETLGDEYTSAQVAQRAAALMMSLEYYNLFGTKLRGEAMVTKAWLERASWLNHEILELSIIRQNLQPHELYEITVEDATRYGLVQ